VGFFGSLLVAMVTRVTQGHSGRPLVLGTIPGIAFVGMQLVAVLRLLAELAANPAPWFLAAGLGWLAVFLPWVLRSLWIYLTPRADGRPGWARKQDRADVLPADQDGAHRRGTGQRWPVRGARGAGAGRPALGDGGTAALPQLQHRHGAADRGADATDRAQAQSLRHSLAGGEAGPAAGLHRPGQPGAQARAQPQDPAVLLPGRARLLRLHVHGGAGAPPAGHPAVAADMTSPAVHPCFLGPYGENDALLERLVVEFLRDHVYWRRNFHPEDPPAIPTGAADEPAFREFEARMRRELHALSAALKRSVPFHSPRYIGHMVSDLLLPGLAAQFLTRPYNPNNVSLDAAPVPSDLELKVGLQRGRMFGYVADPPRPDCAFGHLTSGCTLANFQALRLAL